MGYYIKGTGVPLTQHFNLSELDCKCTECNVTQIDSELLYALEKLRKKIPTPIHITSGYRCESHNKAIGGAENSEHTLGKAVDVVVHGVSPKEVAEIGSEFFNGVGEYKTWTHLDVRSQKARWAK
jgi:uncharacterized protein YcbK (DUF882 family)